MTKQTKHVKAADLKVGRWYVVGWTDGEPIVALCVERRTRVDDAQFWFPGSPERGLRASRDRPWGVDSIDSVEQLLADLGECDVPALPEHLRAVRLEEDR